MNRPDEEASCFSPDWKSPPGDTIAHAMAERCMPLERFSSLMAMTNVKAAQLIRGNVAVSPEIAAKLAVVIGATQEFWLKRERAYDR